MSKLDENITTDRVLPEIEFSGSFGRVVPHHILLIGLPEWIEYVSKLSDTLTH